MSRTLINYHSISEPKDSVIREEHVEFGFLRKLQELQCEYRGDITDRASLEQNFREKFKQLLTWTTKNTKS